MEKKTGKKGFSLIEMLVVIAVVAILVAMVIPTFTHSGVKSRAAANAANLRSIEGKIEVYRLQDPDAFERFAKLGGVLAEVEHSPVFGFFEMLFGESAMTKNYNTLTASTGSITIPMNPMDVTINDIPMATPLEAPASNAADVKINKNTPMVIYFTDTAVTATYKGYTKIDFADIAEDGIYDGDYDPNNQNNLTPGIGGFHIHQDGTGDCICDYKGCGEPFHPGHKDYTLIGGSEYCNNFNPDCPYQRDPNKTYCATTGCDAETGGAKYCTTHACPVCGNEKSAYSENCGDCRCTADWCNKTKVTGSSYCTTHKCQTCNEKNNGNGYCSSHDCQSGSCTNAPQSGTSYCSSHTCGNCHGEKANSRDSYCSSCACGDSSCTNLKGSNGYCSSHTCSGCGGAKTSTYYSYCDSCRCDSTACPNQHISGGSYCTDHTCTESGCTNKRDTLSDKCSTHKDPGCVTPDTLVTLADGSKKRIDAVSYSDYLLVWDFYKGDYAAVPAAIIFDHGYDYNTVIALNFSDGTTVKVVNMHQFYDTTLNNLVTINADNVAQFVGHSFAKQGNKNVKLVSYSVAEEYVEAFGIISAVHYNIFVEGMLSADFMPADYDLFTYFNYGSDMKFDQAQMQADIEQYGLFTYEEFADYLTYEQFIGFNVPYMKVAVGKGNYTYEGILNLISEYLGQ